jgi:hypothetical protein
VNYCISWPPYAPSTPPVYNDSNFRAQFPAFADKTQFTPVALEFAWDMGANWVSQYASADWGLGSSTKRWQQAADLMGAVVARQLSPDGAAGTGNVAAGPVAQAAEGSVNVTFQLPAFGSSALAALLLSNPPYGPMLLALLQISASVGPYIPSGRFSWVPP